MPALDNIVWDLEHLFSFLGGRVILARPHWRGIMITLKDVELLANLLQRAGVNPYEAYWANDIMNELRAEAAVAELKQRKEVANERDE